MPQPLRLTLSIALVVVALNVACSSAVPDDSSSGSSGGITSTGNGNGTGTGTGTGTSGASTGGTGTSGTSSGVNAFLGIWRISGNGTVSYDGGSDSASAATPTPNYQVTFAVSSSAPLVSLDNGGCQLLWDVSGNTATLRVPQSCTALNGTFNITSGNLSMTVVDANHISGSGDLGGVIIDSSDGTITDATGQGAGMLTREGS